MISVKIPRDAAETQAHIIASSEAEITDLEVVNVKSLKESPRALRLIDAVFSLEEGMTAFLWWEDASGESLILPLEGRGRLDLSPVGGIHNPRNEGWTGHVKLTTSHKTPGRKKSFFIGLEFSKVRE